MSWSPAEKIVTKAEASVRASVVRFGKGGKSPSRLSIVLSQALFEILKKPKSFDVLVGHGENEGRIKLTPGGTAFTAGKLPSGGGVRVIITRPSWITDVVRAGAACKDEIVGKDLIVTLPPAFAEAIPRTDAPRPAPSSHLARSAVSVTSSLMGDPPPGRSALAQRGR